MSITTIENEIFANLKVHNFATLYGREFIGKKYLANKILKNKFQLELDQSAKNKKIQKYHNNGGAKGYVLVLSDNLTTLEKELNKINEKNKKNPVILIFHGTQKELLAETKKSALLNELCKTTNIPMIELKERKSDIFPILKHFIKIPNIDINYAENSIRDFLENKINWEQYDLSLLQMMATHIMFKKYYGMENYLAIENVTIDSGSVKKAYFDIRKRLENTPPCPHENNRDENGKCIELENKITELDTCLKTHGLELEKKNTELENNHKKQEKYKKQGKNLSYCLAISIAICINLIIIQSNINPTWEKIILSVVNLIVVSLILFVIPIIMKKLFK